MARPFELKRYLRQTPIQLLKAYFVTNRIAIDLSVFDATSVDPIAAAILEMEDVARGKVESDFRDVDAIANERGINALADEADWHSQNNPAKYLHDARLRERLSGMESDHERAMWIYINRPVYWHGAMRFFQADILGPSQWHKRNDLPKRAARVNEEAQRDLGDALGRYFHERHGRGHLCAIEVFRRRDADYYFCFGQDSSEAPHAWIAGQLARQPLHRTRDVIFIYSSKAGSLDTHARGGFREVAALQAIFAEVTLEHRDLQPAEKDRRVYELDLLKSRDFPFLYDDRSEIESVVLRSLRFSPKYGERPNFIIQGDHAADPQSVHKEIAALGLPLDDLHVTQAEIGIQFTPTPARQNRNVLARLTHPNMCSLRYDGLDLIVRDMLAESGLELQEPSS